jgi:hypothetical protein
MSVVPSCQTNRMPGNEKVVSTRICGETSSNQILVRFLLVKSPTKGLHVLYVVSPIRALFAKPLNRRFIAPKNRGERRVPLGEKRFFGKNSLIGNLRRKGFSTKKGKG